MLGLFLSPDNQRQLHTELMRRARLRLREWTPPNLDQWTSTEWNDEVEAARFHTAARFAGAPASSLGDANEMFLDEACRNVHLGVLAFVRFERLRRYGPTTDNFQRNTDNEDFIRRGDRVEARRPSAFLAPTNPVELLFEGGSLRTMAQLRQIQTTRPIEDDDTTPARLAGLRP